MGPETGGLCGRVRRETESTPHASTSLTALRVVPEREPMERERGNNIPDIQDDHNNSNYDICSKTTLSNDQHNENEGADSQKPSLLKTLPLSRSRSSTADSLAQEDTNLKIDSSPSRLPQLTQVPSISHSLASLSVDSQAPLSSLASSPKSTSHRSYRPSDDGSVDEASSQALASDSEVESDHPSELQDSAPQLIMPSIKMPSRRPFTDKGSAIGRLKVLLAGDCRTGKTSLIKSIVQICEDIVHIDPFTVPVLNKDRFLQSSRRLHTLEANAATQSITEVHASTKPFPSWWSETESSILLRNRKSIGNTVLERNLCFVDTPGYSSGLSRIETIDEIVRYMEAQIKKPFIAGSGDGDLISLLSGNGGSQVDVVLYLLSHSIKHEDLVFLRRLTEISNVIILLSKSDDRSPEETEVLRRSIKDQLSEANIQQFHFSQDKSRQGPFTVCSTPSEDDDNMDASLLMSSEYVQPLVQSELGSVVRQILEKDTAACLRHIAATKLVQAQSRLVHPSTPTFQQAVPNPLPASPNFRQSPSTLSSLSNTLPGLSPFIQAKVADHTQQEERMVQIRLAKWASDLQRSLQNERKRFETLALDERAAWLNERLNEISKDDSSQDQNSSCNGNRCQRPGSGLIDHHTVWNLNDPLGILQWNNLMTERGWLAVQVAGGFGLLGALAMWIAKSASMEYEWNWTWWRDGQPH